MEVPQPAEDRLRMGTKALLLQEAEEVDGLSAVIVVEGDFGRGGMRMRMPIDGGLVSLGVAGAGQWN